MSSSPRHIQRRHCSPGEYAVKAKREMAMPVAPRQQEQVSRLRPTSNVGRPRNRGRQSKNTNHQMSSNITECHSSPGNHRGTPNNGTPTRRGSDAGIRRLPNQRMPGVNFNASYQLESPGVGWRVGWALPWSSHATTAREVPRRSYRPTKSSPNEGSIPAQRPYDTPIFSDDPDEATFRKNGSTTGHAVRS